MTTRERISKQFAEDFPNMPKAKRDGMVDFEMQGIGNAERVDRTRWCECGDEALTESSYYRTDDSHGWFHDPEFGGCGGITQTG